MVLQKRAAQPILGNTRLFFAMLWFAALPGYVCSDKNMRYVSILIKTTLILMAIFLTGCKPTSASAEKAFLKEFKGKNWENTISIETVTLTQTSDNVFIGGACGIYTRNLNGSDRIGDRGCFPVEVIYDGRTIRGRTTGYVY